MDERIEPKRMSGAMAEDVVSRWLHIHEVTPDSIDALLSHIRWLEESNGMLCSAIEQAMDVWAAGGAGNGPRLHDAVGHIVAAYLDALGRATA